MSRKTGHRKLSEDSIVIVCEGTETENTYFEELCSYSSISIKRVVPELSEVVDKNAKRNRQAAVRQLGESNSPGFSGPEYYVGLAEIDNATYEQFKSEPVRWVRAAQLYQERKGYYEAWAVFDMDKGREKAHIHAFSMCTKTLHIAFSAYSIEEWFLLHFERNPKAFSFSECKDTNKKVIDCGAQTCSSVQNCSGSLCIGGRLRKQGYISDYAKQNGKDYAGLTKKRFHVACVNASWSRSLSNEPVFKRNPYSDVDKLVMRLLGINYDIEWLKIGDEFDIAGDAYRIENVNGIVKLIYRGSNTTVISANQIYWCDDEYNMIASACDGLNFCFNIDKAEAVLANKLKGSAVLCIKDIKVNRELYFDV